MSGLSLTSSVLATKALGIAPEGVAAKHEGVCSFCGLHIAVGDLCSPFSVSPSFMDDLSLAARGSGLTCGYCAPLQTATALLQTGYGVFTASGVLPFSKWVDIAAALKNPPNEPFSAVYATAKNQHMAWRAPVNLSPELFYVRVGLRDLKIRHACLMQALDISQEVAAAFGFLPGPKTLAHPFSAFSPTAKSPQLKDVNFGLFRGHITHDYPKDTDEQRAQHAEARIKYKDEIQLLMNLTLGEMWGLGFLLTPGAGSGAGAEGHA